MAGRYHWAFALKIHSSPYPKISSVMLKWAGVLVVLWILRCYNLHFMLSQKRSEVFIDSFPLLRTLYTLFLCLICAQKPSESLFRSSEALDRPFSFLQMPFSCLEKPSQHSKHPKTAITSQNSTQHHLKNLNTAINRA